jgi:PQQ-dependent dehydrogenase (s-GDH family)
MRDKSVRTLGFTLHDDLLGDKPYVYLSYTYRPGANPLQRIVRYTFSVTGANGTLAEPLVLLDSLPASNDHNSGRMVFGPDQKLYYTIGDQGGNQGRNYCKQVLSQVLPSQEEIDQRDWRHYPGKTLRINTDGSIPDDNPEIAGVRSHVFSYGRRNAQGIVFGSNGLLYSDEHGPDTDDEVNLLSAGRNYGWPRVVSFQEGS